MSSSETAPSSREETLRRGFPRQEGFVSRARAVREPPFVLDAVTGQADHVVGGVVMAKILFMSTCGSENPTKATLPLLLAKAAVEEGHEVKIVLAGDAG